MIAHPPDETLPAVNGRVMVVDDNRQARESMADVLRQSGHEVACCSSAEKLRSPVSETIAILSGCRSATVSNNSWIRLAGRKMDGPYSH